MNALLALLGFAFFVRWARRNLTVTTHPDYVVEQGSDCAVQGVEHHV